MHHLVDSYPGMGAGGLWIPDMKELAGGADDWQMPSDASCRITWDQVRSYALACKSWRKHLYAHAAA